MKLFFTQDALVNAGAERSHLEILSRFSKDIDVVFVYFYPKHELKQAYEHAGIRLIFLDIPESYHFWKGITRLINLIQSEKPDLLISCLWRADIITRIASLITGIPIVGTLVNDSYGTLAWKDKKGIKYKFVYWIDRLTACIPLHWIANAQAIKESHIQTLRIKPVNISVIYRGRPIYSSMTWHKASLPTMDKGKMEPILNTFRLVSYGRLLERKGFQDIIFALQDERFQGQLVELTIYGDGPYSSSLQKLITELNLNTRVFIKGKVNNPVSLLNHYDCFIFPSWYEGFSGALVEAMMVGIPIIASDIPMNLEAVKDQESALVFPVRDSQTLAEKITYAINHPQEMAKIGKNARSKAIQAFDIEIIAQQYEQKLRDLFTQISKKQSLSFHRTSFDILIKKKEL